MTTRPPQRLVRRLRQALFGSPRRRDPQALVRHSPSVEELEGRQLPAAGPREQYMLELINRMRASPQPELNLLLNSGNADMNEALDYFHVDRDLLQRQWLSLTPVPPLAWNDRLATAALTHSQLMLERDEQGHQLTGEPPLLQRVQNAGYNPRTVSESIFAYARSVFHTHAAFAIDWGNAPGGIQNPPGHRDNLMDPEFLEVGIGIVESTPGKTTGPLLITNNFAAPLFNGDPFLLGVAYRDANGNGFYDAGEGLANVNVAVSGAPGTFSAQAGPGGGYQVQVPNGFYSVTFSGGGLSGPISRSVSVGQANTKLDLNVLQTPQLQLSATAYQAREGTLATIAVTRNRDLDLAVSVRFATTDGSGRAGVDYDAVNSTLSFAPGETLKTVTVAVRNNGLPDGDRTVNLSLSNPLGGAQLGSPAAAVLTLRDDDQPGRLDLDTGALGAVEGSGAVTVTVTRNNGVGGSVTVAYAVADDTARAGQDYTAVAGTLAFGDGETMKTFTIPIINDTGVERPEAVRLTLSAPTGGATLGPAASATLPIGDDDLPTVANAARPANLTGVAYAFAHSREHYLDFVTKAYASYLDRVPDPGGLDFWATAMQRGLSDEQLEAGFLGSAEYIAGHGGSGREWVRGMYRDLLGRNPIEGEVDYWVGVLNLGVSTRLVAYGFAASPEREGQRVRENYLTYLLREPGEPEIQYWVNTFLLGYSNEDLITGFVASTEYYEKATKGQGNPAAWIANAYRDVLFRNPERAEVESWLTAFGLSV